MQRLVNAIAQIESQLLSQNTENEVWDIICLWAFNKKQNDDTLEQLLQTEFDESGCDNFEDFIDLLLFRIDNNCTLSLEISYNMNGKIAEELNKLGNCQEKRFIKNKQDIKNSEQILLLILMNLYGPKVESCLFNKKLFLGDSVPKNVDFQNKTTLCQFLKDSPPSAFLKETTILELQISETEW